MWCALVRSAACAACGACYEGDGFRVALSSQVAFATKWIEEDPSNDSPWAFIKGLVQPVGYETQPQVQQLCERLAADIAGEAEPPEQTADAAAAKPYCLNALSLLVDILQVTLPLTLTLTLTRSLLMDILQVACPYECHEYRHPCPIATVPYHRPPCVQAQDTPESMARADLLCKRLQKLDPIRVNYWLWRQQQPRAMAK